MIRKVLATAAALLLMAGVAYAGGSFDTGTSSPGLTRPANTTAYTANSLVCASTCAALSFSVAPGPHTGSVFTAQLIKSGTSTTNATFKVFYFSASPTITSLSDGSAYAAPFLADKGIYLGTASCTSGTEGANSDAVYYDCSLSQTALPFATADGKVYAIVTVTGAYTPASGEVFTLRTTGFLD